MPPKSSNKKNQATWFHCEKCNVHITSKSRDTHERVCPLDEDVSGAAVETEFVRNGTLYTSSVQQKNFEVESLKDLPPKYANTLLFMSEGAIQLAQFHIGQQVVVEPALEEAKNPALVRILWPISEQFLTTVFATAEDYRQNWSVFQGKLLRISALNHSQLFAAASVTLRHSNSSESELEPMHLPDVAAVLKRNIVNQVYRNGSELYLNFFNKPLTFRLESWQGVEEDALENALANLSLVNTQQFVQITNATRLEILLNKEQVKEQQPELDQGLSKAKIGGLDKQIELVEESMDFALGYKPMPKGIKISRGLLLYGASGCGKSLICEALCSSAQRSNKNVQIINISSGEVFSKFLGETEQKLAAYFERAYSHYPHPSLIILEDIHTLCPKQDSNDLVKRASLALLSQLDLLSSGCRVETSRTFLLATSSQIDALHPSIRRAGRLDCELELGPPNPAARKEILQCQLQQLEHTIKDVELEHIASITHGYAGADLVNLVYTATLATLKEEPRPLELRDLQAALTQVKPSAMREVLIESPNVLWSDIGGQAALRLTLQQAIEWPLLHADKFQRLGIKPPRGVLMFGPPGCSKTMIAKALATESKLNFLSIKGPELFSMWVGESERAVREVFRKARQVAPAIVFFDEIDAIGGERSEGSAGGSSVKERVLTQLLTELDGVDALHNVTIVAATNRPDMIDKALLRPGRIDRVCYVGLPEAAARREILLIKLRAMPLAEDVIVDQLVELTEGYSGAEIQAVCHEAALSALEQSFEAELVHWRHFESALATVKPRTSPELLLLYQEYMKK
ncbi:PREDICTED: spermatogenesis-associated protein 5 [Drosophila arizonae]|uniref:Spermatogenesis-associated protein 5 n=1 Tax=Drosophila arizonae TaxID=7263 RepID=A0ABM1NSL4_DROAR|nr:PREDICTED: spermatogenesis-associated protein 5 [Drosophila arizonae]